LAVKQINEETHVLDSGLARYKDYLATLTTKFEKVPIQHVPRSKNTQADSLSKLAASGNLNERTIIVMEAPHPNVDLPQILNIGLSKEEWYSLMWRFLTIGELPVKKLEG
jgi:Reverse transcriptase-like